MRAELLGITPDGNLLIKRESGKVVILNATMDDLLALQRKSKIRILRASRISMEDVGPGILAILT